jgi:hypothetical protein
MRKLVTRGAARISGSRTVGESDFDESGDAGLSYAQVNRATARSLDSRSLSRPLRLSLIFFLLLSLVPLSFGIVTSFPPARLPDGLRAWSDTWTRLLAGMPWRSRESTSADATRGHVTDVSWALPAVSNGVERGTVAYGDRLKITFFESLGVTLEENSTKDHVVAAIFPRMDLSAEYTVDEGGV